PAADLGDAVHRRRRILRRAHAARRGNFRGTLIPHARLLSPLPLAQRAVVIAVVGATLRRRAVLRLRLAHLLVARRGLVLVAAVQLAAVTRPAEREQVQAVATPLEAE